MLVVEDNTGLPTADSYISVADFRTHCENYGKDLGDDTDLALEVALRKGFLYVNSNWRYKAQPKRNDQAGEFPRIDLPDGNGRIWNVVPPAVITAQCEAAYIARTEDLFGNFDRGGKITSESVGPISTSYAPDAPAGKLYQAVERLLHPYIRKPGEARRPLPNFADQTAYFSTGMHDAPGASDGEV